MKTAHKMPTDKRSPTLLHDGVLYRLERYRDGNLRLRSRSVHHPVSWATGTSQINLAKQRARRWLDERKAGVPVAGKKTAQDLIEAYEKLPKRAAPAAAADNVEKFKLVLRIVFARSPDQVKLHEIVPSVWSRYFAIRQGLKVPDLSTRRAAHVSHNSTVRCARCLLLDVLGEGYAAHGITMPVAGRVQWLKVIAKEHVEYNDEALISAWSGLDAASAIWRVVAAGRFAGLRRTEIAFCRGGWIVNNKGVWCVKVMDREEEGFFCKSGRPRLSPITNPQVVAVLQSLEPDEMLVPLAEDENRTAWMERVPQKWLRQFMDAKIKKPLHRLRAAYLEQIQRNEMIRLQNAAVEVAAQAGGHRSSKTTKVHYLPAQMAG